MDPPGTSTLFELLPIGAYRSSLAGRQLDANLALARLNGYADVAALLAAVQDIGREWYVDPLRRAEFQALMLRDGQVIDFVSEVYRHHTRERIWIRENAHVVRAADGRPLYYEGTVEDITAQRHAELALQASERRFRAFIERSQVLTAVCDASGRVLYASPASRRLLGRAPEEVLNSHVFDWLHPDDVARAHAELQAVLAYAADTDETVWRVRHADGQWRHLAILANNVLADPAVAGVVLNIRDVSGRTRAEAELRALNAELEQRVQQRTQELVLARDAAEAASRAKSEFLSRMSHELRTPMNAILGFGQLLQGDAALRLAPAAASHLQEILRAGDQLLGLIDQLLDLARIDAGDLPLQLQSVQLQPLADECLRAIAPLAQQQGVLLPLPGQCLLPGRVTADRERLKQVLLSLLANALHRCRSGDAVSLRCETDGDALCISVTDTGPGLDAAQREQLMSAFERLGTRHGAAGDTGFGLASSKRLVELMQGRIGLDSAPGAGSRFWVRLARADSAAPAPSMQAGTVLYIEDNPVNLLLMEAMLGQMTRCRMLAAELPAAGLHLAQAERPDLILLDIQLPGIDGYEVLRRLRAAPSTRDIPVIAVSANALQADIERGRAAGFDDYLTKPIDQPQLLAALQRCLQR